MGKGVNSKKPVILVVGASGMLGHQVFNYFNKLNIFKVYGTFTNANLLASENFFKVDFCVASQIKNLIDKTVPDIIIYCSAITRLVYCELNHDKTFLLHVEAMKTIAEYTPTTKMVYISTDSIFDGITGNYTENSKPEPLNIYAKSKHEGEIQTINLFKNFIVIRTNIFGFHVPLKTSLFEWAFNELKNAKKIFGFNDIIFNPVYVGQLAEITYELIKIEFVGIINIGCNSTVSKFTFLNKIAEKFSFDKKLVEEASSDTFKSQFKRPKNTTLSISKLKKTIINIPDLDTGIDNLFSDMSILNNKIYE